MNNSSEEAPRWGGNQDPCFINGIQDQGGISANGETKKYD